MALWGITTEQLARRLNLSVRTLCQWRKDQNGPSWYKLNRLVYYREDDVDAWLKSRKHP